MIVIYSFTLFISAFLLFWVQLWVGKLLLPLLGGAPEVWNTCMVFFQAVLLLGYGYAHLLSTRLPPKYQAIVHTLFLLIPLTLLPLGLPLDTSPPSSTNPLFWLLGILMVSVGLPSLAIATTAPLMQRWFADATKSSDPYFLYAASNTGSLLSLVSYPIIIETNLSLSQQSHFWSWGYGILVGLTSICAVGLWRYSPELATTEIPEILAENQLGSTKVDDLVNPRLPIDKFALAAEILAGKIPPDRLSPILAAQSATSPSFISLSSSSEITNSLSKKQQFRWVVLAFLPASLLLGVTTYITTDIATVPLFWSIPLIVYLFTFILAFAQNPWLDYRKVLPILPILATILIISFLLQVMRPLFLLVPLHLLGLLIVSYICHGALASDRPEPKHLTLFYFWISVGGVLGGIFNAIASPLLFTSILEYPLILIISFLLLPKLIGNESSSSFRFSIPIGLGLIVATLGVGFTSRFVWSDWLGIGLVISLWAGVYQAFNLSKLRLVVGLLLFSLLGQFSLTTMGKVLVSDRSFFGVYRVVSQDQGQYYSLLHGTTLHGKQSRDPQRQLEPLTYFSRSGPIGQLFNYIPSTKQPPIPRNLQVNNPPEKPSTSLQVAVLGLGVGTLSSYAQPGQAWTFYEIDPAVVKIASNPQYFSFLSEAPTKNQIILGDGRLQLAKTADNTYDLLIMDAFSSDAIPIHLVTLEAIELYLKKLKNNGIIAINISNRFVDLEPVIVNLSQRLGLVEYSQIDRSITELEKDQGKTASHWIVLTRDRESLGNLPQDPRWRRGTLQADAPLWTDDFSDIWQVLRFQSNHTF